MLGLRKIAQRQNEMGQHGRMGMPTQEEQDGGNGTARWTAGGWDWRSLISRTDLRCSRRFPCAPA